MTGKKLVLNLQAYLSPLLEIPVHAFDRNEERQLPCVILGYDTEEPSIPGDTRHFKVGGWAKIIFQGYEDATNEQADETANLITEALCDREELEAALNFAVERPAPDFGLHRLFVRGTTRENEDHSTVIHVAFDAFCVGFDMAG